MPLNLKSVANGSVILNPASTATDKTITLPATDGTMLVQDGTNTTTITNLAYTGTLTGGTGVINIGSGQVYKDASGNVGINTATPAGKMDVVSNAYAAFAARSVSGGVGQSVDALRALNADASQFANAKYTALSHQWFDQNVTERMRLDSSGNLGLGVTPSAWGSTYKAQQIGQAGVLAGHGSVPSFTLTSNAYENSGWKAITTNAAQRIDLSSDNNAIIFYRAPSVTAGSALSWSESARIDSSGNLLINETSISSYFDGKLNVLGRTHIKGNAASLGSLLRLWTTQTSGTDVLVDFSYNAATNTVGTITTNGTSVAYNTSSDYRLKENVAPMTGALEKVAALKPCTYTWKTDGSAGQGFIAHELQAVVPDAVTGEKDAVDADGNPKYQGVDTSFLVATLTAALQEQQAIITQLQADVAALKGAA